ncbi:phytanoyl-CoA dioxygenase family protein [Methylocystis sp. WRRC1]|uniref:phytanoyl-CoA dioxygenase family protein n=1 Tax=Methylocystis sp. WRRC1 TaxID=1732014 RepID=UPI001D14FA3A|nr:phytanoyl-CoA dioxygenase family protein [Methylocystis sp. WRRC1]MCC3245038.1 phytanoyl-CoA dioxygenase family protein [Methylocystis sp. WRRC1]
MNQEIKTHGVTERHINNSEQDRIIEELTRDGFSLVRGCLLKEEVDYTSRRLDEIYAEQVREFGEDNIGLIHDRHIVRSMLAFDDFFLHRIACNECLLEIVKRVIGNNLSLSSQVGILNPPSGELYQTAWHRELQYQHFTISRPIALQTLFAIEPFNELTGGTFFLPGSHLHEMFPSEEYVHKHEVQIKCDPGDAVIFDALAYHRAGVNRSNSIRRAINNLYTVPLIQQQINFSRMMGGRFADDPFLSGLLGYRWQTADSVIQWRREHLQRKQSV